MVLQKSQILIENLLDGVILLNLNLEIIVINSEALKILEWQFSQVYGTNFLNYFDLVIRKTFIKKIKKIITKKNFHKNENFEEMIIFCKKSSKKTFIIIIKIAIEKNFLFGIVLIIRNISKKIKLKKQKTLFISNISHELRTPLFNIQSFIQTLEYSLNNLKQQEIKEFLSITNKEILRLNRIVNNILNISKLNYQNTFSFSLLSISEIFNEFIQIYNIRLKEKNIIILKELENNLDLILAKKDLLLEVFDNLISNALKFSTSNSTIIFRAYSVSNKNLKKVRIEIGDSGIGIPKNLQKNIFRNFSRLNEEIMPIYGNGLGLAITKKILHNQGSLIYFSSEYNEGTIFFFDFTITTENIKSFKSF